MPKCFYQCAPCVESRRTMWTYIAPVEDVAAFDATVRGDASWIRSRQAWEALKPGAHDVTDEVILMELFNGRTPTLDVTADIESCMRHGAPLRNVLYLLERELLKWRDHLVRTLDRAKSKWLCAAELPVRGSSLTMRVQLVPHMFALGVYTGVHAGGAPLLSIASSGGRVVDYTLDGGRLVINHVYMDNGSINYEVQSAQIKNVS